MGWDMRSGFAAARGDYLLVIDGDAQNPPEDLAEMYRRMKANRADVMKGRRIARFDGPYRRIVSGGFNLLFMLLFRTRGLWDINGKPKGLTRAAYEQLELTSDDWFIDAEIVLEARRKGLRDHRDAGDLPPQRRARLVRARLGDLGVRREHGSRPARAEVPRHGARHRRRRRARARADPGAALARLAAYGRSSTGGRSRRPTSRCRATWRDAASLARAAAGADAVLHLAARTHARRDGRLLRGERRGHAAAAGRRGAALRARQHAARSARAAAATATPSARPSGSWSARTPSG